MNVIKQKRRHDEIQHKRDQVTARRAAKRERSLGARVAELLKLTERERMSVLVSLAPNEAGALLGRMCHRELASYVTSVMEAAEVAREVQR